MKSRQETEILYQISLAIGSSMTLEPMLHDTARTLLRVLNATSCVILQRAGKAGSGPVVVRPACLLPRAQADNPAYQVWLADNEQLRQHPPQLPAIREDANCVYYSYELPGFGWLVIGKPVPLTDSMQRAFMPLADKLAKAARACLAEDHMRLATIVFENSQEGIMITDPDNRIIDVNEAFTRITGYERDFVLGCNPNVMSSGQQDDAFYAAMWADLRHHDRWRGELWNRRADGELYAQMLSIAVIRDEQGAIKHHLGVFTDISHLKEHEAELYRISHFDPLTDLPNRRLLDDRLRQGMAHTRRSDTMMAVCLLDLDGFKAVNDQHGHKTGDILLRTIAERLLLCLREGDTIARLGGDEFVLVLLGMRSQDELDDILRRVLESCAIPLQIGTTINQVSASIGATFFPLDDVDADTLLRHADQAMYLAKQEGKNRYRIFNTEEDRQARAFVAIRRRLSDAIAQNELCLFLQPQVDLHDGGITGAEALVRWRHPEHGLLLPGEFLPAIVGTELDTQLGQWVIEEALRLLNAWNDKGHTLRLSVNISAHHLQQTDFAHYLEGALKRYPQVDPADLELEILESAAITRLEDVGNTLRECRRLGIQIALDDFGTGYASLTYFQRLPVQTLKIDQGFVRNMLTDNGDHNIVESIIRLAQAFERTLIAEGVESQQQAGELRRLGCRIIQGYGIARPMPSRDIWLWIDGWQKNTGWLELP